MQPLETARLRLIPATVDMMAAAAEDDRPVLAKLLGARIPEDWPPRIDDEGQMAREGFAYVRNLLRENPGLMGWWGWFVVTKEGVLVGTVSPKGPPVDRVAEVAYGVVASHQRKGFATEATLELMKWISGDVLCDRIVAETFPHLVGSIGVMKKCGMKSLGQGAEPGTIRYGVDL